MKIAGLRRDCVRPSDNAITMNKISVECRKRALLTGGRETEICEGGLLGRGVWAEQNVEVLGLF